MNWKFLLHILLVVFLGVFLSRRRSKKNCLSFDFDSTPTSWCNEMKTTVIHFDFFLSFFLELSSSTSILFRVFLLNIFSSNVVECRLFSFGQFAAFYLFFWRMDQQLHFFWEIMKPTKKSRNINSDIIINIFSTFLVDSIFVIADATRSYFYLHV